jgi:hypothetical protein
MKHTLLGSLKKAVKRFGCIVMCSVSGKFFHTVIDPGMFRIRLTNPAARMVLVSHKVYIGLDNFLDQRLKNRGFYNY